MIINPLEAVKNSKKQLQQTQQQPNQQTSTSDSTKSSLQFDERQQQIYNQQVRQSNSDTFKSDQQEHHNKNQQDQSVSNSNSDINTDDQSKKAEINLQQNLQSQSKQPLTKISQNHFINYANNFPVNGNHNQKIVVFEQNQSPMSQQQTSIIFSDPLANQKNLLSNSKIINQIQFRGIERKNRFNQHIKQKSSQGFVAAGNLISNQYSIDEADPNYAAIAQTTTNLLPLPLGTLRERSVQIKLNSTLNNNNTNHQNHFPSNLKSNQQMHSLSPIQFQNQNAQKTLIGQSLPLTSIMELQGASSSTTKQQFLNSPTQVPGQDQRFFKILTQQHQQKLHQQVNAGFSNGLNKFEIIQTLQFPTQQIIMTSNKYQARNNVDLTSQQDENNLGQNGMLNSSGNYQQLKQQKISLSKRLSQINQNKNQQLHSSPQEQTQTNFLQISTDFQGNKKDKVLNKLKEDEQRLINSLNSNQKLIQEHLKSVNLNSIANNQNLDLKINTIINNQNNFTSRDVSNQISRRSRVASLNQSESSNLYQHRYNMYRNQQNNLLKHTLTSESANNLKMSQMISEVASSSGQSRKQENNNGIQSQPMRIQNQNDDLLLKNEQIDDNEDYNNQNIIERLQQQQKQQLMDLQDENKLQQSKKGKRVMSQDINSNNGKSDYKRDISQITPSNWMIKQNIFAEQGNAIFNKRTEQVKNQEGFLPQIDAKSGLRQSQNYPQKLSQLEPNLLASQINSNQQSNRINTSSHKSGNNISGSGKVKTQFGIHYKNNLLSKQQLQVSDRMEKMIDIQETQDEQSYTMVYQDLTQDIEDSSKQEYQDEPKNNENYFQQEQLNIQLLNHQNQNEISVENSANDTNQNFNLKNCLDIKQNITLTSSKPQKAFQIPNQNGIFSLPVQTDKMISYQSFSPANLIKKTKNRPSNAANKDGSQGDKKVPHQVLKQKFLRQKMQLSQYQQFQGKMIPFQSLAPINQDEQKERASNPGQMFLTGSNLNKLTDPLTYSQQHLPFKDTLVSNHQSQLAIDLNMYQNHLAQTLNHAYNSPINLGLTSDEGMLLLEKYGLSLKSLDYSSFNQKAQFLQQHLLQNNPSVANNPTLMIYSINSLLKTHQMNSQQTSNSGNYSRTMSFQNGVLKQNSSHKSLKNARDASNKDEVIDKFDLKLQNENKTIFNQKYLTDNQQNLLKLEAEDIYDELQEEEDDEQSECLSEKSHDENNNDDETIENDQAKSQGQISVPLTDRQANNGYLNKEIQSQSTISKANSKFLTSTKIQLKPLHVTQVSKLLCMQTSSVTPQSQSKPSYIIKKFKDTHSNQQSKNCNTESKAEMLKKLQLRKQEFLTSNLQQYQLSYKQRKKKAFGNVLCTIPKNLKEQELLFFASGFQTNPNFSYENYGITQRYVQDFSFNKDEKLLDIAVKIIEAFLSEYGSEKEFIETEGRLLTREETEQYFQKYISELQLEEFLALNFTQNAIAPTSITHAMNGKKSKINICLPIDYSEGRIMGVMHHEIGTHFVRKFNDKYQPWVGKRQIYQLTGSLDTEEGLACINQQLENTGYNQSLITHKLKPFLFRPALYYYCCYQAQLLSFVDLFKDLEKYIQDHHRRWKYVMRVKRGLQNTEEPGGFYKDQVYLRGAVEILKNRDNLNFEDLYTGKIALDDVLLVQNDLKKLKLNKDKNVIKLPSFLNDMNLYKQAIDEIAEVNFIK